MACNVLFLFCTRPSEILRWIFFWLNVAELVSPLESNLIQILFTFSIYCASSAWVNNNSYELLQVLLIFNIIEENFVSSSSQMNTDFDFKVFSVRKIICLLLCCSHVLWPWTSYPLWLFIHLNVPCQVTFVCNSNKWKQVLGIKHYQAFSCNSCYKGCCL